MASTPSHPIPANHRLPSIRSVPVLAAHLPPLSSFSSPASSRSTLSTAESLDGDTDETMTTISTAEEDGGEDERQSVVWEKKPSSRLGRKLPNKACGPCKKHHTECGPARPCGTCVRRGRAHLCVDVPSKRSFKSRQRNAALAASTPVFQRPSLSRSPPSSQIYLHPQPALPSLHLKPLPGKPLPPPRQPLFRRNQSLLQPSPSLKQHSPLVVPHGSRSPPERSSFATLFAYPAPSTTFPRRALPPISSTSSPARPTSPPLVAPASPVKRPSLDALHRLSGGAAVSSVRTSCSVEVGGRTVRVVKRVV